MSQKPKVLIVDDEAPIRDVLSASLMDEAYDVRVASSGDDAILQMEDFRPQVVLLDIWMPGSKDGIDVLRVCKPNYPMSEFIVMSGHGNIETAVKATKLGAWDFIEKPISMEKIFILLSNIILYQRERGEKIALLNRLRKNIAIVGEGALIVSIKQLISRVAAGQTAVLVTGESGVGKQLVAENIHYLSSRAGRPFIEVNCAAVPPELLESEIFGYERDAFAGATVAKKGKLELANGGTLFLDEISIADARVQERIMRTILEKKFERVGGSESLEVDIRIIASTHRDLQNDVKAGKFRDDLFQKLKSNSLHVPSLRERRDDIPSLVLHFSEHFAREGAHKIKQFSEEATVMLKSYQWAGNVRELRNFIERIYILTPGELVNVHDLKFAGLNALDEGLDGTLSDVSNFKMARAQFEKEYILKKLSENNGNVSKTAEIIGLERSHLHRKIKSYGIDVT